MMRRPSLLVQGGSGLAFTAVGVAVPASGADGMIVLIPSGCAIVGGLSLVLAGVRQAAAQRRPALPSLEERAEGLGRRILRFLADRAVQTPTEPINVVSGFVQRRAHDEDTVELYREKFLPQVRAVLRDLLEVGRLGQKEARRLLMAHDCAGIERVGRRLVELATDPPGPAPST